MRGRREFGVEGGIGGVGIAPYGRRSYLYGAGALDYITRSALSEISVSSAFTICSKFKAANLTGVKTLAGNTNASSDRFSLEINDDNLRVSTYDGAFISKSGTVTTGTHSAVATYDGVATLKLYIDTAEAVGVNIAGTATTQSFVIGARTDTVSNNFIGNIWDVRVFSRVITGAEITKYQNSTDIANPVLWYKTTEWTGTTAIDSSINGNGGTISANNIVTFRHNDTYGYKV